MRALAAFLSFATVLAQAAPARAQADAPPQGYERVPGDGFVVERMAIDEGTAASVVALFREGRAQVEGRLGQPLGDAPPLLVLAPTDEEFARRHRDLTGSSPGEGVLAIAVPARRAVLVRCSRLAFGDAALSPTLRHELAHLVLANVARKSGGPLPRWLEEGLAELASGVVPSREDELELAAAARAGSLERFSDLETAFPPHAEQAARDYRMALDFALWLDQRGKPSGVRTVVGELAAGYAPDGAIRHATGLSAHEAEYAWKLELASRASVAESLLRSSAFWWGAVALLAVLAFARQLLVSRRLRAKLGDEAGD